MKRVFFHFKECEEFSAGMWRMVTGADREPYILATARLMGNPQEFADAMRKAVAQWPTSCEYNLTCASNNHRAWMGHAGCCIATGSPEELTRLGWHRLSGDQQDAANAAADMVIAEWLAVYVAARQPLFAWGETNA